MSSSEFSLKDGHLFLTIYTCRVQLAVVVVVSLEVANKLLGNFVPVVPFGPLSLLELWGFLG